MIDDIQNIKINFKSLFNKKIFNQWFISLINNGKLDLSKHIYFIGNRINEI